MRDPNVNFNILHKTCTLVVLLCCLHIFVTVVYYVRSLDFRQSFVQNQQQNRQQVQRKLEGHAGSTEDPKPASTLAFNSTVTEKLEKCPDPSPLLGMKPFLKTCLIVCSTVYERDI